MSQAKGDLISREAAIEWFRNFFQNNWGMAGAAVIGLNSLPAIQTLPAMDTGMVRRIDELGRVVIPKNVRALAGITENDPLAISYTKDDAGYQIVLRLYKPEEATP